MQDFNWTAERTDAEWDAAAEDFAAKARECEERRARSIEDSDTDGFLSQWASSEMARRYRSMASVCRDRGLVETVTLFKDGEPVPTKQVDGQYGVSWALLERWDTRSRICGWVGMSHASTDARQAAHYAKKGFTLGTIRVRVEFEGRSDRMVERLDLGHEAVNANILA